MAPAVHPGPDAGCQWCRQTVRCRAGPKSLTAAGVGSYITGLGVLEFVVVALFLWPTTRNAGFFLACSYLGGAMATHLTHGEPITVPTVVLVLFWVAMFLTKPRLFVQRGEA